MQANHVQPHTRSRHLMSRLIALTCGLAALAIGGAAQAVEAVGFIPGQFGVSPTGAANYTIPLAVPPGTAGMVPTLSINYNSQGGNGLLGVGWSLSGLSAITRCPKTKLQDGIATLREPIKYNTTDRYCLDGQRLVLHTGTYGADGAEYRTERESFSRIISYGSSGASGASPVSGAGYFKVWTKAGLIMEYGNTPDSLIEQQGKTSVQVWALNRVTDTLGNYYKITYQDNGNDHGEFYPTRIDYTGNDKPQLGLQPYNSVRFTYEARPDSPVLYDNTGSSMQSTKRLGNIQTYATVDGTDTLVKSYRFTYGIGGMSFATNRSHLSSIDECDGSVPLNGSVPPVCLNLVNTWNVGTISNSVATQVGTGAGWNGIPHRYVGDFNGDGKSDLLVQNATLATSGSLCTGLGAQATFACTALTLPAGTVGVGTVADFNSDGYDDYLGNTQLCWGPALTTCVASGAAASKARYVGNVNGDQYPDVIYYSATLINKVSDDPGANYRFSRGYCLGPNLNACFQSVVSNFEYVDHYPIRSGLPPSVVDLTLGDFNADGKTDLMYTTNSAGTYLCSGEAVGQGNAACTLMNNGYWGTYYRSHSSDFNGDGISDLFLIGDAGSYFCPGPGIATGNNCQLVTYSAWKTAYSILPGDYNGDGVADLYMVSTGGALFCPGPGITTTNNCQGKYVGDWKTSNDIRPGDFDGNGTTDLFLISDASRSFVEVGAGKGERVEGFYPNNLWLETSITYKPLTDATVYTKATGSAVKGAGYMELQVPMYVVSSVWNNNGVGGGIRSDYFYWYARSHLDGGGFMGFNVVRSCNISTTPNLCTQTYYTQDYPYQGLVFKVTKFAKTGTTSRFLSMVNNVWKYATNPNLIAQDSQYNVPQLEQSQEASYALVNNGLGQGQVVSNVTTTNTYDDYGNPLVISVASSDVSVTPYPVYRKTTTNTYDNLEGVNPDGSIRWLLGRLKTATVESVKP